MCLHKNNSKCITELNIEFRARVAKPQEENTGEGLYDLELDRFLRYDAKCMIHKRQRLISWTFSKLKPFALQTPLRKLKYKPKTKVI